MKTLYFLAFLAISVAASCDEFRSHVKIECASGEATASFSGTVIDYDNGYVVATCAHGISFPKETRSIIVTAYGATTKTAYALVLAEDIDKDVAILKIADIGTIRPIKLASASLADGTECQSYGYCPDFVRKVVSVDLKPVKNESPNLEDHKLRGANGDVLLVCAGDVVPSMSGGALVHQNRVYGLLSARDEGIAIYSTLEQINDVINKAK